jgi:hypothetical protein
LIVLPISLSEEFSAGAAGEYSGLRIQTAAKGVNDFVKAMRLLAGPLDKNYFGETA